MSQVIFETLYPYRGTEGQATPLLFEAGEEITVLKKQENGWWEGERNGMKGWFPAAYVKEKIIINPLPPPPPEIQMEEPLAPGWKQVQTPEGKKYYYNRKTKETTWHRPTVKKMEENNSTAKQMNNDKANKSHSRTFSSSSSLSPPNSPRPSKTSNNNQPVLYVVNGVCLPDTKAAKEQELLQPGRYSYCDYFWRDKDEKHVYESGFSVLLTKAAMGKQLSKEMAELFKAREALELQYSKGLALLAAESYAQSEEGTLSEAWKQVKTSLLTESKIHRDFATKLKTEVEKPLYDYKEEGKKDLKKLETSISDLRKQLTHRYQAVEREKLAMDERQKDYETKLQSPKKTEEEISRAKRKSTKQREGLGQAISLYNNAKNSWFEETVTSTLVLEEKEVARINMVKKQLNKYVKLVQGVTTKTNKATDAVKDKVTSCDPAKDRELWVKENKTGSLRPVDMLR